MNKKVKEVYEKNQNMQKDQYTNHKYDVLYDPEEERLKKRGKTVNCKTRGEDDMMMEIFIKPTERYGTAKVENHEIPTRM